LIALFNVVAILCPYCDFIAHSLARTQSSLHGFPPPHRLLSYSTTTDPDLPRWYRPFHINLTMLSVKTEPGSPASPALIRSTGVQTDSDLWNHYLASSLDMDKKSEPFSQPSTRRGRGDRPNSAHPPSTGTPPAQANAAAASSAVR
jgi:hypothetical protein